MLAEGLVRRFPAIKALSEGTVGMRLTGLLSLATAQVEANAHERARAGRTFILGNSAAITGIGGVATMPTTAAQWSIWNNDSQKSYFFEEIGMYLTSGTLTPGCMLLAAFVTSYTAVVTGSSTAGISVTSSSNSAVASRAIVKSSLTTNTPAYPNWYPLAFDPSPNTTAFASSVLLEHRNIAGGIVLPPQQGLSLAVVAATTGTPLFAPFARWYEMETDLE